MKAKVSILKKIEEQKVVVIAFVLSVILTLFAAFKTPQTENAPEQIEDITSIDTKIPKGFVLVPINVQNSEALNSVLGATGVVDLYISHISGRGPSQKVASRIKILRAPLNPEAFAVLAPEQEASQLVILDQPFTVMVQNPNQTGTHIQKKPTKHRRRIVVENP